MFLLLATVANAALVFQVGNGDADCAAMAAVCDGNTACKAHDAAVKVCMDSLNTVYSGMGAPTIDLTHGIQNEAEANNYGLCSLFENMAATTLPAMNQMFRNVMECSAFTNWAANGMAAPFIADFVLGSKCWDAATICFLDTDCLTSFNTHVAKAKEKNFPMNDWVKTRYNIDMPNFALWTKDQVCEYAEIVDEEFKTGKYNHKEHIAGACFATEYNWDVEHCYSKVVDKIKKMVFLFIVISSLVGILLGGAIFGGVWCCCCRGKAAKTMDNP